MFGRKREMDKLKDRIFELEFLVRESEEKIIKLRKEHIKDILNERSSFENYYEGVIHDQKVKYEKEIKELKEKYNVREFDIGEEVRYGKHIYEVIAIQDDYLTIECISSHNKGIIKLVKSNDLSLGELTDGQIVLPFE